MRTQAWMAKQAKLRPNNFEELSPEEQWEIDKKLDILDWDGNDILHEEYRLAFQRCFKDKNLETTYVRFDGWTARNEFLRRGWNYALNQEWLRIVDVELEQEFFYKGYLTEKGEKEVLNVT